MRRYTAVIHNKTKDFAAHVIYVQAEDADDAAKLVKINHCKEGDCFVFGRLEAGHREVEELLGSPPKDIPSPFILNDPYNKNQKEI